ncbi:hypothetical protein DDB_G0276655 [Dictyostelium discoideum AX4]|uniref:Uncharacterized protein n=1 Tax=Dictyostelium discoideum TaxID=44689 RepID=Q551C6_DICDI|nr:hypothetical protein DDB_G0276655 [Dictyostelium discoideum AX4]EAL69085.1 hypothetical protein DDB_G0276655 [Dictyostelium discoideum AX4]|eukprot:XP_643012.1 hypothetical protein DDB_G0276655 [Dictyostelium discoideum AX4]
MLFKSLISLSNNVSKVSTLISVENNENSINTTTNTITLRSTVFFTRPNFINY